MQAKIGLKIVYVYSQFLILNYSVERLFQIYKSLIQILKCWIKTHLKFSSRCLHFNNSFKLEKTFMIVNVIQNNVNFKKEIQR